MKVHTLGTGDAFDHRSLNSAFVIDVKNQHWLFDCGLTVPVQLWKMGLTDIDVIYISHTHTDHCAGLSSLLNYWSANKREKTLTIICQNRDKAQLSLLCQFGLQYEQNVMFEIKWVDIHQDIDLGVPFRVARTTHSVCNFSLLLDETLFISGDGKATPESIALMQSADLVLHECVDCSEAGKTHTSLKELQAILPKLSKPIYIYHFNECDRTALTLFLQSDASQLLEPNIYLLQPEQVITI